MATQIRTKLPAVKPLQNINYNGYINNQRVHTQYNPLTRYCKQNELTKLSEDQCYLSRRDHDSRKPFKWRTYHHHPYGCKVESTCYPGQFYWDGYGAGGCNIDDESRVNRNPGYEATNLNVHQELPTMPIQMPRVRGYFDSDTESNLRFEATYNKKQCTATTEKSFNPYRFQIFDHLCFNPQDPKYIQETDSFNGCFPNAKFWMRGGEDTRHDRQEKFRSGCDYKAKYFSPNLNFSNFGY